jgi:hypothetical protein
MNLGFSKSDTGIAMNQDHASVIHNIKKVKGLLEVNDTVITSALLSVRHALNLDAIESFQDAVKQNNFLLSENALLKEEVKLLKGKIEMVKEIIN